MYKIVRGNFEPLPAGRYDPRLCALVDALLAREPGARPTARALWRDPWLAAKKADIEEWVEAKQRGRVARPPNPGAARGERRRARGLPGELRGVRGGGGARARAPRRRTRLAQRAGPHAAGADAGAQGRSGATPADGAPGRRAGAGPEPPGARRRPGGGRGGGLGHQLRRNYRDAERLCPREAAGGGPFSERDGKVGPEPGPLGASPAGRGGGGGAEPDVPGAGTPGGGECERPAAARAGQGANGEGGAVGRPAADGGAVWSPKRPRPPGKRASSTRATSRTTPTRRTEECLPRSWTSRSRAGPPRGPPR